jgi:hypothetical protein
VWPVGLLLSVEVLSRVSWAPGFWWALARYGGAGTVAVGSAVISYGHVREVLLAWGYGSLGAAVGPLVLDGLMVVSGFALLTMSGGPARASGSTMADHAVEAGWRRCLSVLDAINEAKAQRAAARVELEGAPAPTLITEAEVYAMIDSLGDVGAALKDAEAGSSRTAVPRARVGTPLRTTRASSGCPARTACG